jgi:hypothetical protein
MRQRLASIAIISACTIAGMPSPPSSATLYSNAELSDVYAVYSSLLREHRKGFGWNECAVQREAEVENFEVEGVRPLKNKRKYNAEVQDFLVRNKAAFSIEPRFDSDIPCSVLSVPDIKAEIQKWYTPPPPPKPGQTVAPMPAPAPRFHHIFVFSVVGFNSDRSHALVYIGHHCGRLCGAGTLAALMKSHGKWRIDFKYKPASGVWVS